jgi:2-hydroxy-6-oxonona-2,4-dienedioate hydrolase
MTIFSQYQRESQTQSAQLIAGSRVIDTACGPVEFGETGTGPVVILSHGSVGGYDQGLWLAGLLGGGFRYLAPSRFGYLRAPLPADASPTAQARQYAALLDALEVERAAVVGISAGGPSALEFALKYPNRCTSLVMISAISHRMTEMPWFFKALFFGLMKVNFLPWLLLRFNPAGVYRTNGVGPALFRQIRKDPEKMRILHDLATTSLLPALRRPGLMNEWQQATGMDPCPLEKISVPTLVVHAINDPVVAIEFGHYSASHIPGARLLEVADGGHFCCATHREVVVAEILDFLNARQG